MYPLLKDLERQQLISSSIQKRSTLYHLTALGKKHLRELLSHRQEMLAKLDRTHKYMEHICGQKQSDMKQIFQRIVQGKAPFGVFTFNALHFRKTLFKASTLSLTDKQKHQIKTLLHQTTKEIDTICKKS
ncbi:PadR family transcriptional regulator [Candidatus Woesearchaeota archaeon]|nr:PadR family transcriptional regulator [Candidatus Woesearchaeota archaeon]